jgi:hypothetical protein
MQTNILNSTAKVFEKTSFETRFGVFLPFFWVVAFLFVQKWKVKNIAFNFIEKEILKLGNARRAFRELNIPYSEDSSKTAFQRRKQKLKDRH